MERFRLWPELDGVPPEFVPSSGFDPERLRSRLPFFRELDPADPNVWVHRKRPDRRCRLRPLWTWQE